MTPQDPFFVLSDLLSEMQLELGRRAWSADIWTRIGEAAAFRKELWNAIEAYRDARLGSYREFV